MAEPYFPPMNSKVLLHFSVLSPEGQVLDNRTAEAWVRGFDPEEPEIVDLATIVDGEPHMHYRVPPLHALGLRDGEPTGWVQLP